MTELIEFLAGATAMACGAIALYFVRFYRQTGDRLFVFFAVAFVLMTINRTVLAVVHPSEAATPYVYLVRLAAFLLIAYAVIDKNRAPR